MVTVLKPMFLKMMVGEEETGGFVKISKAEARTGMED
jgi:hypothetical protein